MLDVQGVVKSFGGLTAVNNVDLTIGRGEILGLVGPNGAGKTTLLNCIAGVYRSDLGAIYFNGEDITKLKIHEVCKRGIAKTFQNPRSFPGLDAVQSVMVGILFGNSHKAALTEAEAKATELLDFVGFPREKLHSTIAHLNLIELKRTQLARALASKPDLLLLDELTTGLNPTESHEAVALIKKIRDSGVTILIIEHVMRVIMGVSDRIVVLDHGEKIAEGPPASVVADQQVIDTYLGSRYTERWNAGARYT